MWIKFYFFNGITIRKCCQKLMLYKTQEFSSCTKVFKEDRKRFKVEDLVLNELYLVIREVIEQRSVSFGSWQSNLIDYLILSFWKSDKIAICEFLGKNLSNIVPESSCLPDITKWLFPFSQTKSSLRDFCF